MFEKLKIRHPGLAARFSDGRIHYRFSIANHDPVAKHLLQAEIKADGGADSLGDIVGLQV